MKKTKRLTGPGFTVLFNSKDHGAITLVISELEDQQVAPST